MSAPETLADVIAIAMAKAPRYLVTAVEILPQRAWGRFTVWAELWPDGVEYVGSWEVREAGR